MPYNSFEELQGVIRELYYNNQYEEAFRLATAQTENFPEEAPLLFYWRITLAARMGEPSKALSLLKDVLQTGFWFGDALLRRNPSLQSLRNHPEFEQLVALNQGLQEADPTRHYPLLTLRSEGSCQAGGPSCPLLIGMHANGSTARDSVDFWRAAATAGWLVAVPQSSQPMWKGAYSWDDRQVTRKEIIRHFEQLGTQYAVNDQQIIMAGHSLGGEMAIWLALTEAIPARGFIAIAPTGPLTDDPENWQPLIQEYRNTHLRGYILLGEEDLTISAPGIQSLADQLNDAGIACEVEVISHVGKDFAPEMEDGLLRGLEFITGE